jgi:PAS domain S-box-containing protein
MLAFTSGSWANGSDDALGRTAAKSSPSPGLVTDFASYWAMGLRDQVRTVDVNILVTYYDPGWGNLWGIIDGEVGFLHCGPGLSFGTGDRVRIQGTLATANGLSADNARFTVIERNVPLPTVDARGRLGDYERLKSHFVTVEGIVNRQDLREPDRIILEVVAEGFRVHVYHYALNRQPLPVEPGSIVRLKGLYNPMHEVRTGMLDIDLWVGRREDMTILGHVSNDPRFQIPLSPIETLPLLFNENAPQARVAGVVKSYNPGQGIVLRDATGQVLIRTQQILPVQIGEVVEAVGKPFAGGTEWMLQGSVMREASRSARVAVMNALAEPGTALRLADQVLALSPTEAAEGRAVDLHGVVVRPRTRTGFLFLSDASGTVRVDIGELDTVLLKGGVGLRIRGVTTPGGFVPGVKALSYETWGVAILPEARPATLEQAMSGAEEGRRLELRGYLAQVTTDRWFSRLTVSTPTGDFTAIVRAGPDWQTLVGSIVSVRGLCQAVADAQRQLIGIELYVSSEDDIHVEQAALLDPFTAPVRKIAAFRQFNASSDKNYWTRIRGVVTHHLPGRFVFVQDGRDGLMILASQTDELVPGDVIEATGLPGLDGRRAVLRQAVYRKVGHEAEPPPSDLGEPRVVIEALEDCLVQVRGTLISAADGHLLLKAGDAVFTAVMPRPHGSASAPHWESGSVLQLSGVYEVVRDERRRAKEFRLQLRSASDVIVLRRPSWWTPQRALLVVVGLCGCIAGGTGWVLALRRRVQRQTEQIRSQIVKEATLEARHRDVFENASDFIFTTDQAGRFTSFNPAGERISGYSRADALRRTLSELLTFDEAGPELMERLCAHPEETVTLQGRLRTRDGREVWTETSARLIREAGEPAGVLGIVRDISERKQIEGELRRARDAAEANTRMKSTFLANMSHEIRTPMNGVIGMSNLLLETQLDAEQREFAETIRTSADSLLTVLNDILDFSKIEAGKLQFETLDFEPVETVEGALDLLAPRAAAKGIELASFVSPEVPRHLRGDPGRLRQVLLNLVGNALKFTERGEIVLHATVLEETNQQALLRFEVSDTGVGMGPETVQKLFKPFSQADASTTRRFGGTGLGLAIARQIVELMHGTIGVQSQLGRGSTFWFTVPFKKAAIPAPAEALADLAALAGVRILAVDDVTVNRRIVSHYARAWGLRADVVADGHEALARMRAAHEEGDPIRLVISDYQMPELDGVMLAGAMRQEPALAQIPFILFTSLDRRLTSAEIKALGIGAVVMKPIHVHELLGAVRKALGGGAQSTPTRPAFPLKAGGAEIDGESSRLPARLGRVLVAEDNVVNQRVIALQLNKLGYAVDIAANGFEVLDALERASYHVVLMDCQMPEMDGYEATRRIRNSRHRQVRIVALTANAMEGDREHCLAAGMDDYLSKPTRPADLQAALQRAGTARAA